MNKFLLLALILIAALLLSCAKESAYPEAPVSGAEIVIDTLPLKPDLPQYFTYLGPDRKINLFVIRIDDEVLSFLDACLSCTPRRGFAFSDGYFTCKVCGTKYSVSEVKHGIGGCYPIRIPGELKGDKYHIKISSLAK